MAVREKLKSTPAAGWPQQGKNPRPLPTGPYFPAVNQPATFTRRGTKKAWRVPQRPKRTVFPAGRRIRGATSLLRRMVISSFMYVLAVAQYLAGYRPRPRPGKWKPVKSDFDTLHAGAYILEGAGPFRSLLPENENLRKWMIFNRNKNTCRLLHSECTLTYTCATEKWLYFRQLRQLLQQILCSG